MSDLLARCEVCQSLLDEEDMFCANCGTESPLHEKRPPAGESVDHQPGRHFATHNFECSGCGASMSFDAREGKLRCPFCGSVKMNRREDAKIMAPHRVVEFAISQNEAEQRMRQWLGRGFFRPGDLSRRAAVVEMTPVYVPYWVFEAKTHTYWTADSSHTPAMAKSNWYPVSGEHRGDYQGILVGASGALHSSETSQICPFDISTGKDPDEVDLQNVTVEQFAIPRKYARPIARGGLDQFEAQACEALVPGRARNVRVNVRVEAMAGEPMLLPVWIMAYRYKDETYRFLVNGQTGKATGKAPTSMVKVLGVAAVIIAIVLFILLLLGLGGGGLGMNETRDDTTNRVSQVLEPVPRSGERYPSGSFSPLVSCGHPGSRTWATRLRTFQRRVTTRPTNPTKTYKPTTPSMSTQAWYMPPGRNLKPETNLTQQKCT